MRRKRVFVLVWKVGERGESLSGGERVVAGAFGEWCERYEEDVTKGDG